MKTGLSFGLAVLAMVLFGYFGVLMIMGNTKIDIQLHDTYFVTEWRQILPVIFCLSICVVLLGWVLATRFQKIIVNVLLLTTILALVLGLTFLSGLVTQLNTTVKFDMAPASGYAIHTDPYNTGSMFLICLQICMLLTFFFVAFKTGSAYNKNKK